MHVINHLINHEVRNPTSEGLKLNQEIHLPFSRLRTFNVHFWKAHNSGYSKLDCSFNIYIYIPDCILKTYIRISIIFKN